MSILSIIYLLASISFIVGLKMLSHPDTARRGNIIAAIGMFAAIFATIFLYKDKTGTHLGNVSLILSALVLGTIAGYYSAKKVAMTAMPEMVSIFNGMGGACAALISVGEFRHWLHDPGVVENGFHIVRSITKVSLTTIVAGLIIGSISFSGSLIAYLKLSGRLKDYRFNAQTLVNIVLLLGIIALSVFFLIKTPELYNNQVAVKNNSILIFYTLLVGSLIYGILFVFPIGGADMPVVISLLNSLTGMAAACGGFLYDNNVMMTGGILVGAAGTLLTILMCKAMNRSLTNVLLGNFGGSNASAGKGGAQGEQVYKEISLSDTAVLLKYANKVVIVPGYGLAVAQAQHICHELEKILSAEGVNVSYAIHPVAGRMPGHMNVLLAEADVSYEKLEEMEQANEQFAQTDVVLVLGANDVVNPAAKNNPQSPIYGMPILDVDLAKQVIINKRSMKPGYAGIENELFFYPKSSMLFGDAKKVLQDLVTEIKSN